MLTHTLGSGALAGTWRFSLRASSRDVPLRLNFVPHHPPVFYTFDENGNEKESLLVCNNLFWAPLSSLFHSRRCSTQDRHERFLAGGVAGRPQHSGGTGCGIPPADGLQELMAEKGFIKKELL